MKLREFLIELKEDIAKQNQMVALIQRDLEYHIKRTDLLEDSLKNTNARLRPIIKIYNFLQVAGGLIIVGAAGAAILDLFVK
jgi:hypothetical protein